MRSGCYSSFPRGERLGRWMSIWIRRARRSPSLGSGGLDHLAGRVLLSNTGRSGWIGLDLPVRDTLVVVVVVVVNEDSRLLHSRAGVHRSSTPG